MKITKIEQDGEVFTVTFKPSIIEKLFGCKEYSEKYKTDYSQYKYGGGLVYYKKDGEKLGNGHWIGEALDNFQRSW